MGRRRAAEEFSISFLDVICCGFGAVILLLMITHVSKPPVFEHAEELNARIAALQQQLQQTRGETVVLNRDLDSRKEQLSEQL